MKGTKDILLEKIRSGVAMGALVGTASGIIAGGAIGFLSNGLNNCVSENSFMDGAWNATRSGTARADLDYRVIYSGLSRMNARVMEQMMINQFGLENLYNSINSIAPKYWDYYNIMP